MPTRTCRAGIRCSVESPESRAQVFLEPLHGERPRLFDRRFVRTILSGLLTCEAVARAIEHVRLIRLLQRLHRGISRRYWRADTRIRAAVQSEDRRLHSGEVLERRRAVIDDGRA